MCAKKNKSAARPGATAKPARAVLTREATEAMLSYAAPPVAAPSGQVKKRLLARIKASNTARIPAVLPGWRFESAAATTGWQVGAPGIQVKILSVDERRDVAMLLVKMAPGSRFPDHSHDAGGDEGLVLSGDVFTGGRLMRAGEYYWAAEGTAHTDTVSPSGCTSVVSLTARAWHQWHRQMAPA